MKKTYIIDTNVLLDNTECINELRNGEENQILIPYSVILELDRIKNRDNLSHIISKAIENLHRDIDLYKVIKIPNKNYTYNTSNDDSIFEDIMYAFNNEDYYFKYNDPIVITNDRLFRLRLKINEIETQEYFSSNPFKSDSEKYTGFVDNINEAISNSFFKEGNEIWWEKTGDMIYHDNIVWGINPRNYYQNCALQLMMDDDIKVVTLQSQAGLGKTILALASAFQLTLQKPKKYKKIYIFKPIIHFAEKLGFLPGDYKEKMEPYLINIYDLINKLHEIRPANSIFKNGKPGNDLESKKIEILDLNFVRGMNIEDSVVIVDEAQDMTRQQMRTVLTRMCNNVKVFIVGDTNQINNNLLNSENNGLNWCVKKFKGNEIYGHLTLSGNKSRGIITDLVIKSKL